MLHHRLLDHEVTYHLHREHPVAAPEGVTESPNAETANPATFPWALAAAVAGNVLAGGILMAALLAAPMVLQRILSLL